MSHDSNLRHIYVTSPEFVVRIHFLKFAENESNIGDQNFVCEPADGNTLRSAIRRLPASKVRI
jgi:hypothetical protein